MNVDNEEQNKSVKREFGLSDKNVNAPILARSDSFGLRSKDSNLKGKAKTTEDKQSLTLPTKRNKGIIYTFFYSFFFFVKLVFYICRS